MQRKRHQDIFAGDIEWRGGSGNGIEYARFPLAESNSASPTVILTRFGPGAEVPPHTHDTNYLEYIIEGEQKVGKVTFGKGDVRIVNGGTGYGPIKIGPDGCTVLIVFEDGSRANMQQLPRPRAEAAPLV